MGRALCEQQVGAVNGSAMLVRRSLFERLDGFDTVHFPLAHGALDFCLRAGESGARIVWTPYSMVVHYGAVSLKARQRSPQGALADLLARAGVGTMAGEALEFHIEGMRAEGLEIPAPSSLDQLASDARAAANTARARLAAGAPPRAWPPARKPHSATAALRCVLARTASST